jgi:hypothetical protein
MEIFSEVNESLREKDMELIEFKDVEIDEVYLSFVDSLMVDTQSCIRGYEIFMSFDLIGEVFKALETICNLYKIESRQILPADMRYISVALKVMEKLLVDGVKETSPFFKIALSFFQYLENICISLIPPLPFIIKGRLSSVLSKMVDETENRTRVCEYLKNVEMFGRDKIYRYFEEEKAADSFSLTGGFINLCRAILLKSTDAWFLEEACAFALHSISSEDPTVIDSSLALLGGFFERSEKAEVFASQFKPNRIHTLCKHIKEGIIKEERLCEVFLDFCISLSKGNKEYLKLIVKNVSLMNAIISIESRNFFEFIKEIPLVDFYIFLTMISLKEFL